jgi:periplasmic protein TonB
MPDTKMKRRLRFTIYHGLAVSLALHSAVAVPFAAHVLMPPPEDYDIVIDLQGVDADIQTEQKVLQETKGEAKQDEVKAEKPAEPSPAPPVPSSQQQRDVVAEEKDEDGTPPPSPTPSKPTPAADTSPPAAEKKSGSEGANNVQGTDEQQIAQRVYTEHERIQAYVIQISKKVQANLIKHQERKSPAVSFTILSTGQIRPESMKIVESTGSPNLDAAALQTVRAALPFPPPPKEITVKLTLDYGHAR